MFGDLAEPTRPLSQSYLPPERLVAVAEKFAVAACPGGKGRSDRLGEVMKALLQTTELDYLHRIKVSDFLCHCVLGYKAILGQAKTVGEPKSEPRLAKSSAMSKSFYTVSDMAREWGELAHQQRKIVQARSQRQLASGGTSALRFANNPPPSRGYVLGYPTKIAKQLLAGKGPGPASGRKSQQTQKKQGSILATTDIRQRARTPLGFEEKSPDTKHEALEERIRQLEGQLRTERSQAAERVQSLEQDNARLQSALEDVSRTCRDFAAKNSRLRAILGSAATPAKAEVQNFRSPPPRQKGKAVVMSTGKEGDTATTMSEMLEFIGSESTRKRGRRRDFSPRERREVADSVGDNNKARDANDAEECTICVIILGSSAAPSSTEKRGGRRR